MFRNTSRIRAIHRRPGESRRVAGCCRGPIILLTAILALGGCVSAPTYKDLVPQSIPPATSQRLGGTVDAQSMIIPRYVEGGQALPSGRLTLLLDGFVTNDMLKPALGEAVTKSNLFAGVNQGNADYVLDVWVENMKNHTPTMGMGEYTADAVSIWRLMRTSDGKVLFCDFVNGHGLITSGMAPLRRSLFAALRNMVENGIAALSDRSTEHFGARSTAGLRKSMGNAVPEGYAEWSATVKQNWPKLRMGLTFTEVEACIGPVKTSGALVKTYSQGYTEEYETSLYTVVFLNGKLSRWEVRGSGQ